MGLKVYESGFEILKSNDTVLCKEESKKITGKASIDQPWLKYYSKEVIESPFPEMTIYDYIYSANKDHLDMVALEYFGRKITYGELFDNIEKTAKALKNYGIKKDDIVSISMPTTPEAVYLFYALAKLGAVSNMIDPRISEQGIKDYINEVNSTLLFVIDVAYGKIKKIVKDTNLDKVVTISPADSLPLALNLGYKAKQFFKSNTLNLKNEECIKWGDFIKTGKEYKGKTTEEYKKDTPVTIVHTGGTTGTPKGVLLSNDNLNALAYQFKVSGMDLQRGHRFLDIMPPFIAYGVGNGLHMPLVVGMETILIPAFDPKKFDELILKQRPNHMAGVPTHWENVINSKKMVNKDLSFILTPGIGGDSMNLNLEEKTNEFLKSHKSPAMSAKGYGLTEVSSAVCACIGEQNKLGSVGIPFINNIISVFEPGTDNELGYNERGEICISSPTIMLGYYENEAETSKILKKHSDGRMWIHTEDLGYVDEDGMVFIDGRIKRLIIRHDGFKVYPFLIEEVISSHYAVEQCKVVGIPDLDYSQGSVPKAHIILKEGYEDSADLIQSEIKQLCLQKLPEYAQPREYKFRNAFPFTSIGKVDFMALENEDALKEKPKVMVKKLQR